ncbi:hypothetical protein LIER_11964 [Lithospermum erythrorhizon]|uniref:Reverse transcriptase n=1 Tax=Lithospermum erythrorhizon TaxID=34254 RepID=A0AAV3PRE4_LITER
MGSILTQLKPFSHLLILFCGDFNQVLFNSEKSSTPKSTIPGSLHLLNFVNELAIEGLPHTRCNFSWSGVRKGVLIYEKLDHAMGNYEWLNTFSTSSCVGLPIQKSDHGPLIISTKNVKSSITRPFKMDHSSHAYLISLLLWQIHGPYPSLKNPILQTHISWSSISKMLKKLLKIGTSTELKTSL